MIPLATFRELLDYNYWARDRQLQACAALTGEQLLRPLPGSFASLRDTLVHLLAVEWLWLERWRGRSPRTLLPPSEFPSLAAISDRWIQVEREQKEHLETLDDVALGATLTYLNTRGQTWSYPLWRMMLHLLNHQSYHRGQVTGLLRALGTQPPPVDFLNAHDMQFRI